MTNPVNNYTIGDTSTYSITALMECTEIQRRGFMQYKLLNYDNTGVVGLCANAGFNLNGSLYFITEDQEALYRSASTTYADISTAPTGDYYLFIVGLGAEYKLFVAKVSDTTVVYDAEIAGWVEQYTQNYLIGGVTVATAGSRYTLKWVVDPKSTATLSRIYATGYDLPVYRLQNPTYIGSKASFSFSGSYSLTIKYPCILSIDISAVSDARRSSGNENNIPSLEHQINGNTYVVGVIINETDGTTTRDYMPYAAYEHCVYSQSAFSYGHCTWTLTNAYTSKNVSVVMMPGEYTLTACNASAVCYVRNTFGNNSATEY